MILRMAWCEGGKESDPISALIHQSSKHLQYFYCPPRNAMVKLGLYIKADLSGVTNLTPVDTINDPFLYTFKVLCNSCHEVHESWVTIQRNVARPY